MDKTALGGIKIIDYSQFLSGALAATVLATFGADTIHLENLKRPDGLRGTLKFFGLSRAIPGGRNALFDIINRNKKGFAIDIDHPEARPVLTKLIQNVDVFLTNYTQRHLNEHGLSYETLSRINPKLVYCSVTSFGQKGPISEIPAFDQLGQARGGTMMSGQDPNVPRIPWPGLADMTAAYNAAFGIMVALMAREKHGVGQEVTTSLLGSIVALQEIFVSQYGLLGKEIQKRGRSEAGNPLFNFYRCKDGKWIHLNFFQSDRHWPAFCKAVDKPEWENDARFANAVKREENSRELTDLLDRIFLTRTCDEWTSVFWEHKLSTSPVQSIADLFSDPQVMENDYIINADHPTLGAVRLTGFPVQLEKTPARFTSFGPMHGENTEEVLIDWCGYSWKNIQTFKEKGII